MATPKEIQSHIDRAKTALTYMTRSGRRDIPADDVRSVLDNLTIDIRGTLPSNVSRLKPTANSDTSPQAIRRLIDTLSDWHRDLGRQTARR
jgi:hypothetical protein